MDLDPTTDPEEDDDDPITASYSIYVNPSLPLGRRLLVLQHPNRTDDAPRPPPTEMRLKPRAGLVEVDVPLDHAAAYDRDKGLRWGRALTASMAAKSGGSHGLAGGFGIGAVQQRAAAAARKRAGDAAAADEDDAVLDWSEAVRQDKVLRIQTLGGQYPDTKDVQYMVGVFRGDDLHLTPVSSLVHLRPQLHHIDATTQLDRHSGSSKDGAVSTSATGSGPGPRAIHMTIKTTSDGDLVTTETIADRLRSVQAEPWRKLRYVDENDEAAWEVYNDSLFLKPGADDSGATGGEGAEQSSLHSQVPDFGTRWGDKELLEAVSGIRKSEPEPETEPQVQARDGPKHDQTQHDIKSDPAPTRRPSTRTRGGGPAGGARRGGRSKATTSKTG